MKFNLSNLLNVQALISELSIGLKRLNLVNNFEAKEVEVAVAPAEEARVQHSLGFIPTRYLIVDFSGNAVISRGTSSWDKTFAYLYNYGPNSATFKVIFHR